MNVTIFIPDDPAARFGSEAELGRRAVEALALEEYRGGRLTRPELRQLLGFVTPDELADFLRDRSMAEGTSVDELDGPRQNSGGHLADDLVARFRAFANGHSLVGLEVADLIRDGRR